MRFALLLCAITIARCQTVPVSAPASPTKATLPNLFLAGAEYQDGASPHFSGFVAIALPVSTTAGLYSYSMYQGLVIGGKLVTSTTTGLADDLKTFCVKAGCFVLVGLATAGASTSSATQAAFAGGGGLLFRFTNSWAVSFFEVQNTAAGVSKPSALLAFGRTW
jgi:hypothetical protein